MILASPPAVPLLEATEVHPVKPKVRSPIPGPPCLIRTDNEVAPPFELSMGLPPNPAAWRNRPDSAASSAGELEPPVLTTIGGTVPRIRYDEANTVFVETC